MEPTARSVERMKLATTSPHKQVVSVMTKASLSHLVNYPNLEHALSGIDTETLLPVEANITISTEREYTCMTCESSIEVEERHVIIAGVYSYRQRDKQVLDHHHLHTSCFHDNELPFWDNIVTSPMDKQRRTIILGRIRETKMRRKSSTQPA